MRIGHYKLKNNLFLAPMAGVTDRPFRGLCRRLGAGMAASEMVSSNSLLWGSEKNKRRADHAGEEEPRAVQIVGSDPALMQNEKLVAEILQAVVKSVDVPVTLKIRTGWDSANRNGPAIARIAEACGIQALAVHGRTRADTFQGEAEYDTIAAIKAAVNIPVIANGDITTPEKAAFVLQRTGVDGLMIGRAAQGNPWIFREISHFLATGEKLAPPPVTEVRDTLLAHLDTLYAFYGEFSGVRMARKHISWYSKGLRDGAAFRHRVNQVETCEAQVTMVREFFDLQEQAMAAPAHPAPAMYRDVQVSREAGSRERPAFVHPCTAEMAA